MITITPDFAKRYLEGAEKSEEYKQRVEECEKIKMHSVDKPDEKMLRKYQPSEPDWAIEYKTENWRAITKTHFEKIESVIAKIFRASDFVIKFEESGANGTADGESLQDYVTEKFPKTKSFLYYFQKIWLRQYLVEPNGVTLVKPLNMDKAATEYWQPYPYQICSEKVLYFTENILIIRKDQNFWEIVDKNDFVTVEKRKDKYISTLTFSHKLGYIPAIYNGGKICLDDESNFYYESVVSGVCPWWAQALVEEADKNVAIKQHMHPEKAVYGEDKCQACKGDGKISRLVGLQRTPEVSICRDCKGSGIATPLTSGFGLHVVRPARAGEAPLPDWAPSKYIQKDISPLEFLDKDIDKLIVQGYAAVSMEQLAETTSDKTESGIKKAYDWEQTNLFLYNIAVDFCQFKLPWFFRVFSDYRYGKGGQQMSDDSIEKMQPQINTPQRFDIVGVNDLKTQIIEMKEKGVSPDIINELEKQLVGKEFAGDTDTVNYLTAVIELDPLRNFVVDDKSLMYASGAINLIDYAVSSNIQTLVQKAAVENGFYELSFVEKREKIYALAKKENIGQKAVTIPMNATAQ